jgi:hypothetical protein
MRGKTKTNAILLGCAALALAPSGAAGQFNNPPVPTNDTATTGSCTILTRNVVANDSDPDGDYPLTLTSVGYWGDRGFAYAMNGTYIVFEAGGTTGTAAISYTVSDSRGATATGTFTVTVTRSNYLCP